MAGNGTQNSTASATAWENALKNITFFGRYIFPAITVIAILGSLLVLSTLILKRKYTRLPVSTNIALSYLLAIDIVYLTIKFVSGIYYEISGIHSLSASEGACIVLPILSTSSSTLQGYIQSIVSIERVIAIATPLKVKQLVTRRRMIFLLFLVSIIILILQIAYSILGYQFRNGECETVTQREFAMGVYDSIVYCGIPTVILFTCTCTIIAILLKRRRISVNQARGNLSKTEIRLALTLIVMDIVYLFTTLPFTVEWYLDRNGNATAESKVYWEFQQDLFSLLTKLGALTDWLVLICLGRQIRMAILRMLGCVRLDQENHSTMYNSRQILEDR